jgi:hypothetical protein
MVITTRRNSLLFRIFKWMVFAITSMIALFACLALIYLASTQNSPSGSQQHAGSE